MPFWNKDKSGRSYEWSDGTVHDKPEPAGHKGGGKQGGGGGGSSNGLSVSLTSLHAQEAAAAAAGNWERAAEVKHMLNNADSRSHWISKAVEMKQENADDPAFAQKMFDICMENARKAPNP